MELRTVGVIKVHEFIALDGVFEDPSWTFEFGFDPKMGEALGDLARTWDIRDVRPGLVRPVRRGRPGRAVL
jgi:hypothetical protein